MIINTRSYFDACAKAYLECLLWQEILWCESCGERGYRVVDTCEAGEDFHCGHGYDETFSVDDIDNANETLGMLRDFLAANWRDVRDLAPRQVGHDFCLTRHHHGAGFWDRGLGERGERLTTSAHSYGSVYLSYGVNAAGTSVVYVTE